MPGKDERRRRSPGYTLTEIMIVLSIIAVLVTLAVNQFFGPKEQALEREAVACLKLIADGERDYRLEKDTYVNGTNATDINSKLNLMLFVENAKWEYKVQGASASAFTAVAVRSPSSSGKASICINQSVEEPFKTGCTW